MVRGAGLMKKIEGSGTIRKRFLTPMLSLIMLYKAAGQKGGYCGPRPDGSVLTLDPQTKILNDDGSISVGRTL
jgi:hypothetical protein